jgi:hypothetical protein
MIAVSRRVAFFAALALFALTAACGDNEAEQRKAFIGFLQEKVINRTGVHIPLLSADEKSSFGDYTKHYEVMTDFADNPELKEKTKTFFQGLPPLHTAQNLIDNRVTLRRYASELGAVQQAMDDLYVKTKAARDALKQPDDLKAVYDKAFDKMITAPLQGFRAVTPIAQAIGIAGANLGDYVVAHADSVKVIGSSLQAKDRKTQAEVDALTVALNSNAKRFNDAQHSLRVILQGS